MVGLAVAYLRHSQLQFSHTGLQLAGLGAIAPALSLWVALVPLRPQLFAYLRSHRRVQQLFEQALDSVAPLKQLLRQLFNRVTVFMGHRFVSFVDGLS